MMKEKQRSPSTCIVRVRTVCVDAHESKEKLAAQYLSMYRYISMYTLERQQHLQKSSDRNNREIINKNAAEREIQRES